MNALFLKKLEPVNLAKIIALSLTFGTIILMTQENLNWRDLLAPIAKPVKTEETVKFENIGLPQAIRFFHAERTIFLDVRAKQFYDYGHIEDALNLPVEPPFVITDELLAKLKAVPAVVVYCNGISCGLVYVAARELMQRGLDNVYVYPEGWPEWRSCRLPMTMSPAMKKDVENELKGTDQ
ncbi:MAG: rhodanese-like domain-containing protein [Verrucomicrobiales bacterium]|jgi:rhodanese-related sulfurtransferase|nr:rhodanese-like domain-containing protein [Verrucomicrobiales bacterium]